MGSFPRDHWPALSRRSPFAGNASLVESELWHDRPAAEVHRFVVDHGDRRAAYYYKRHKSDSQRAAIEYRALVRLAEHFAGRDDVGVVEPVAFLEPDAALVTAEFAGTDLREVVRRGARRGAGAAAREAAEEGVRAAARFVREMQASAAGPGDETFDLEPLFCWVTDDLGVCLETDMLDGPTAARARSALEQARRRYAGQRLPVVVANSDTKLWNFLIGSGGRLRALDFVGIQRDLPSHDVARLWVGLDWLRVFPGTSGAAIDRLQSILVDALAGDPLFERDAFQLHRLCVAIRSAAFASGIPRDRYRRKLRSVVGFPLIRRYYTALVRRCLPGDAGEVELPPAGDLARRLEERAAAYFADLDGPVEVSERSFAHRSTYPIHRFAIRGAGGEREVVVKVAPAFVDNNEALTEYRNLRRLAPAAIAPEPLDFLDDLNAVVTGHVEHRRLSDWLLENNRAGASAATIEALRSRNRQAGQLLAVIHRETAAGEISIADSDLSTGLWRYLELAYEHGLDHGSCDAVARLFADLPPRLAALRVPVALAHGDYGPQNLGIAGDRLVVFDLQRNRDAVVYEDIAYYLVTLETINPLPRQPLFSRSRAMSWAGDFLAGYFGRELSADEEMALRLHYLKHLIQRLHKQSCNVARTGSWLRRQVFVRRWLARKYPAALGRELEALDRLVSR